LASVQIKAEWYRQHPRIEGERGKRFGIYWEGKKYAETNSTRLLS